ncbi:two-component system response regulator CreB [Thalassomonas viridans]|uniref:Two-component system response regulator CreB n=1 Tax=Thalassomonas viridans TaxID=137584 RepID=A0AAE9Z200_9GAMM|nr:two-component system response regulator CreB [Thalassomonas viridans]WDE05103.1 two-component system response regulator CreB [Thalassomonas viridans]
MANKHILIVEDEASIADNISYALKAEGFASTWVSLGQEALDFLADKPADLVILDVGLPDISGFEVCKNIRQHSDVPIIFLTARGEEIDRVVGLEIGGDDYVVKPFSPRELVARVKVILKRHYARPGQEASAPGFTVDEEKRQITYCSSKLELTAYEYGILKLLLSQPERVFTREQLMNAVWSTPEESFDRAVDTHIKTIRAKLRAIEPDDNSLVTHRGVGYSIQPGQVRY